MPLAHPEKPIPEDFKKQIKALPPAMPLAMPVVEEKELISKYEEEKKTKNNIMIIVLIFILFLVFASLAGILLFKDELINFFANLFQ